MIPVAALLPEELASKLSLRPSFKGKQVFKWICACAKSFDEMTNISKAERTELSSKAILRSSSVTRTVKDTDGTIKLQITLQDGAVIEAVLLVDANGRKTACLSSQAGCAMKCAFCYTGLLGLTRNLEPYEIIEEFLHLENAAGKIDNVVFMGMGEPLENLPAVRKAISVLTHKDGFALSIRRITLSTSGIIKGIYDIADNGPHVRLAVSLTAASSDLRQHLMPCAKGNPLQDLKKAICYYIDKTGRRVTLEAVLLHGVNAGDDSARKMADFALGMNVHINLIPWNSAAELPFKSPAPQECAHFASVLSNAGLNVTIRTHRGRAAAAACGQLGKSPDK